MKRNGVTMRGNIGILLLVTVIFFVVSVAWAQEEPDVLVGPTFSDPSKILDMPEGWKDQLIRYEPDTTGADLVVTLNQHIYPALLPFIEEFAKQRGLKIAISDGTCGTAAGGLASKSVDIAGFCCPPGEIDRLPGVEFHTLGIEPVALIVHQENPLNDISFDDARRVFQGKVYKWSELGGADMPIQTVGRLHCKLRPGHWRLLLDNEDLFSPRLKEVGTIPDMISLVAANPRAVGYEAIQMIREYGGGKVKMLRIDGLDPEDLSNLESGRYPLYRVMGITTWKGKNLENPIARELVDYLLEQADHIDKKFGIVPASTLRKNGWKFLGDELIGEPE